MTNTFFTEAKILARLGTPLIISHMAVVGVATADTLFAAMVSTEDLAGLAIAASVWSWLSVVVLAMCGSISTIVANFYGGGRYSRIGLQANQSGRVSFTVAVLVTIILATSSAWLPFIQPDTASTRLAYEYLTILATGALAFTLLSWLRAICEAVGDTHIAMVANLTMLILNIVLDYALVFGKFGLPELGTLGCAWASVIAFWIMAAAITVYVTTRKRYRPYHLFSRLWPFKSHHIKRHLSISIPIALGTGGEVLFFTSTALFLAPFGATAVAGHQIVMNVSAVIYMIPLGLSVALCIRVAQLSGAGQLSAARHAAYTGIKIAIIVAVITAISTVLLRSLIVGWYTDDTQLATLAAGLFLLCACYQVFDSAQVAAWGALRGLGDAKVPMLAQLTSYYVFGLPTGLLLAYGLEMGPYGMWGGLITGLVIAAGLLNLRLRAKTRAWRVRHTQGSPAV